MILYVVRHGEVPSNVCEIVSGRNDEKLTENGIEQAQKMKEKLQNIKFDRVYSSPVYRAFQTSSIVAPKENIIIDERLTERDPGTMIGKPRKLIDKDIWNSLEIDITKEGGETLKAELKRVKEFLLEKQIEDDNKTILIVTHNSISKCIWILMNDITNKEEINKFFHNNGEIKKYVKKQI